MARRRAGGARLAGTALAAALLAGCVAPRGLDLGRLPAAAPDRVELVETPFVPQDELYCGPAALTTVLRWSGRAATQAELASVVFTPGREGTLRHDVLSAARRHGRLATPVEDLPALLTELAAGHPVLVLRNLGLDLVPQWHYAVAVGYDRIAGELVLRSGREARRAVSFATFERTWARADHWGLVVLPPDRLPASAGEADLLQAASGIERADRAAAAATAYQTMLLRWPDSLGALIGLANARYGAGELAAAQAALLRATGAHPDSAIAWNNLAHTLAAGGEHVAALAAAERAVELGGPLAAVARATRDEIRQQAADASPRVRPAALADRAPAR
jgi:hypothetical protein